MKTQPVNSVFRIASQTVRVWWPGSHQCSVRTPHECGFFLPCSTQGWSNTSFVVLMYFVMFLFFLLIFRHHLAVIFLLLMAKQIILVRKSLMNIPTCIFTGYWRTENGCYILIWMGFFWFLFFFLLFGRSVKSWSLIHLFQCFGVRNRKQTQ